MYRSFDSAKLRRSAEALAARGHVQRAEALLLAYLEGNSYGEIASSLGLQVKQVDNALQRAKKKLARCYGGLGDA